MGLTNSDVTLLVNAMIANPHISDITVDLSIKSDFKKSMIMMYL